MKTLYPIAVATLLSACATSETKPDQFVDLKTVAPNIAYEIRYVTNNNFVGTRVDGYLAAKCLIHKDAARALAEVNKVLLKQNKRLKVFDCYRPQKAVAHFMRWVQDGRDLITKEEYYPNLRKEVLVGDYIAETSGHSRGYTVDLTIEAFIDGEYQELDMGSPFDMFDTLSNTDDPRISKHQKTNRYLLKEIMLAHGFSDYSMEWWHFTYAEDPRTKYWNFDVK